MFKPNGKDEMEDFNGAEDTVIGSSIKIEGDLVSNGSIVVEGEVKGSLKTEKSLRIGERAKVVADVSAQEAVISGKVNGNIAVTDKLELAATAEVNGDIKAGTLTIAAGAVFNGNCAMGEDGKDSFKSKEIAKTDEE
ncbi:MAG: polymer-forming cytoskeletal protein [Parcubacteria group bacterium]